MENVEGLKRFCLEIKIIRKCPFILFYPSIYLFRAQMFSGWLKKSVLCQIKNGNNYKKNKIFRKLFIANWWHQ